MRYRRRFEWRHHLAEPGHGRILKKCLMAALILECSYGIHLMVPALPAGVPIIRRQDNITVEWFVPARGQRTEENEVYGIRLDWRAGELRFYRRSGQIKSH